MWANILEVKVANERVAVLKLLLGQDIKLPVIQCYAPTFEAKEANKASFYLALQETIEKQGEFYTLIMGDFNAKVGADPRGMVCVGPYGLGTRNQEPGTVRVEDRLNLLKGII